MHEYILSFAAGIFSALSPCIIPVVPILFSEAIMGDKRQIAFFSAGFASVFLSVILLTAVFTAAVNYYLLYLRIPASIVIILMGVWLLSEKPLLSFRVPATENHLLLGFLTALAWSPCYSPYLVTVISYSALETGRVILNLLLYTGGLSAVLIALVLMAERPFKRLAKRTGDLRKFGGFMVIAAGIYMLYQLIG
ncbi:cytochrome c biogenesis protein CcdA [Methanothermobacter sp. KEPCO-1]|uniref:cytochrome c biogenesis CcdA family protein n=1 Tax=Methanothermobacter sp. KEPCO-1 TaxID=2603820 RepID=UPI0011CC35B6|nr:cytochrome c biogenesis CcdA family protein [Methanothermobacter sp. KEPCO-1]QEF94201.1 cytochrome c biogenesis protein CcdA [Methanothermobacter sp. KEPCO-1]